MFKVMIVMKRRAGMSPAEFRRYWRAVHGPIAAAMPGVLRYVQHHAVPGPTGVEPAYDGVAELWYADVECWRKSRETPETAASRQDLPNFCAPDGAGYLFVEDVVLAG